MPLPTHTPGPGPNPGPSPGDPDFEEFYLGSRRRLVLEAYALTGDLSAARSAVRDAFIAARQHWRRVGGRTDPEEWVRPRAWAMAQRRHVARLWRRDKGLSAAQKSVLDALHHLPDQQRKVLLLTHLAGLGGAEIGRELGETPARVEEQLRSATRGLTRETGREEGASVPAALELLAPIAESAALPSALTIHRGGLRRRRLHALTTVVVLAVLTIAGGILVNGGEPGSAGTRTQAVQHPVTKAMLLSLPQVQSLAPRERWDTVATTDNTTGSGINSVCQDARFADPRGRGTLVRTFVAPGTPRRNYLETVEVSRSEPAAQAAYRTTLGWFAGCNEARLQLLNTYLVTGLGDEARMLKLRIPGGLSRTYVVGVVRTGSLTVSTVLETLDGQPVQIGRVLHTLSDAVGNVCGSDPSGPCPVRVSAAPVLPPPSGETTGTLAAADLPVVGSINRPWVGTQPVRAQPNVAATSCDKTDFLKAGAPGAMTRTFLIPQAGLPRRFGITETYGRFASPGRAAALVRGISTDLRTCEKRDLGAKVSSQFVQRRGYRGSEFALWRVDSEINQSASVSFWMGVARVGGYVAQVNFTPTGKNDIDQVTFQALMTRARDRLFELPPTP